MPSVARAAFGGAVMGLGQGLFNRSEHEADDLAMQRKAAIQSAAEIRQELMRQSGNLALEDVRSKNDSAREDQRAANQRSLEDQRAGNERGLLQGVEEDDQGNAVGVTRGGQKTPLGFKLKDKPGRGSADDGTGLSAADQRLWNALKTRFTDKDEDGVAHTDYAGMASAFKQQGRNDLAELAMPKGTEPDPNAIDPNDPAYGEAQKRADAWVSGQAGWLSSDKSDFKDYGGNRETARAAKTDEYYRGMKGKPGSTKKDSAPGGDEAPQGAKPKGSGTQQDPYTPTSQAEFDAVGAGDIYRNPADGKLYRKN